MTPEAKAVAAPTGRGRANDVGLPLVGSRRDSHVRSVIAGGERQRYKNLLFRLPSLALLGLIRVYQRTLSPALPILTLGRCGCRFSPTCSHYAAEAIRTHGALAGLGLALARLVKCTPLHPGGFDPVPLSPSLRRTSPPRRAPRCERPVALSSSL